MPIKHVLILSRTEAEAFVPTEGTACISITDPHDPPANICAGVDPILKLKFEDTEHADDGIYAFEYSQAEEVFHFVFKLPSTCSLLIVHSEHGNSRSVAMGKLIGEWLGCSVEGLTETPNALVTEMMGRVAFREEMKHPEYAKMRACVKEKLGAN